MALSALPRQLRTRSITRPESACATYRLRSISYDCSGQEVSIGQLFVAAHKEINRLEQTKTVPLAIDATAEPVPVATELTDARDGPERGKIISGPALNVSRGAASWPSMLVQLEDADDVKW